MLLLYRDRSKLELWEEREVEGVGTLNYYISPGIDEEMMDYILEEVDGVVDYDLIPGYYESSYEYELLHPDPHAMFSIEDTQNLRFQTRCQAMRKSEHFEEFQNGNFKLTEGRYITPKDEHVVMIPKEFAQRNGLKIGGSFRIQGDSLTVRGFPEVPLGLIEIEIIGIYETTYNQVVTEYTNECDILNNWILVDNETGYDLDKIYGDLWSLWVSTIYVENPAAVFMGTFADWYSCVSFCYDYKLCSNPDNWWANIWNGTPGERTKSLYRERNRGSYCP